MAHQRATKKEQHRFNRYMVECEFYICSCDDKMYRCFNRYMVECELQMILTTASTINSFNRYMVECECIYQNCMTIWLRVF